RGRRGVGRGGRWPATGPVPTVGGAGIARRHRRRKHAMIAHLVQSYGYYAVFALIAPESLGIPLPGESALIAAALYARTTHHLNTAALAAAAAAAAVIGDNAGYWTSKTGGRGSPAQRPIDHPCQHLHAGGSDDQPNRRNRRTRPGDQPDPAIGVAPRIRRASRGPRPGLATLATRAPLFGPGRRPGNWPHRLGHQTPASRRRRRRGRRGTAGDRRARPRRLGHPHHRR